MGFELADFIFTEAELSKKKANRLLELLAATLIPHGAKPSIRDHADLLRQVDSIPLGNVPWECFSLSYDGPPPETTHTPEWKTSEYEVWFRNPRDVIHGILGNPEFNGHIDYAAYQEFNDFQRQYSNMMSGDWAWRQSVCRMPRAHCRRSPSGRILLLRILQRMARCSCRSFLGRTRQLFPLQPVRTNITLSTSRLATFKIT